MPLSIALFSGIKFLREQVPENVTFGFEFALDNIVVDFPLIAGNETYPPPPPPPISPSACTAVLGSSSRRSRPRRLHDS